MSIANPEIKKLYGLAAGRCSICKIDLFSNDVHIGEMAHIIAKNTGGARGNESLSSDRNSYDNLILLCANHHTEVDQNPNRYTVEELHKIKSEHECAVASFFGVSRDRENDISFLRIFMQFVPFTKLRYFADGLPLSVQLELCSVGDMFEAHLVDNPHLYPLNDNNLQAYFQSFMDGYYALWGVISGFTFVDGRQQANFTSAGDGRCLHMERRYLPYNEVSRLSDELVERRDNFLRAYFDLMAFLRSNYGEVDLNSYVPYKI